MTGRSALGPQIVRLRPAPHCRTRIPSYSLDVTPAAAFRQLAAGPARQLAGAFRLSGEDHGIFASTVDLLADMEVINPFDFFVEPYAEKWPFTFRRRAARGSGGLRRSGAGGPAAEGIRAVDFARAAQHRRFSGRAQSAPAHDDPLHLRMEPGVQTPEETLTPAPAPAAIRRGCWCRSCATSACRRVSSPAISSSSGPT